MANYVYAYVAAMITMAVLDAAWLGFIAPAFYRRHIGFLMADKTNMSAAVIFYLIYVLGLTVFVVYPGWRDADGSLKIAVMGALFGLVAYATYDLTNHATLKDWPMIVTVVDVLWGTALTAAVCTASVAVLNRLLD